MIRTLGNKTVSSSSECRTMNGAAALYYNSPALDDGDDGSSGSKQQQQQRRQAQAGVVGGDCWSTRRVFGELTKQAQAIERRHTNTHTHTGTMRVRALHTHILLFIHLCVWWPV